MKGKCDAPIKCNVNPGQNPNLHCIIATLIPLAWVYCDPSSDMALYEITHSIAATLYPPSSNLQAQFYHIVGYVGERDKSARLVAQLHSSTQSQFNVQ